jgi:uncharacterized protein (UPF0332 family)
MKADDFLLLAKRLANGSTEAEWRSAVSRAYYAVFHIGREFMQSLGFRVPRDDRAHKYLSWRLSNSGNPASKEAGFDLDSLRAQRNEADYDLRRVVSKEVALSGIQFAEQIIQSLAEARKEPTRSQITETMKSYERDVLQEVTWRP